MRTPKLCKNCYNWKVYKENCWFYWKNKTKCSQFVDIKTGEKRMHYLNDESLKKCDKREIDKNYKKKIRRN